MRRYIKVEGFYTMRCVEIDVDKIANFIEMNHILSAVPVHKCPKQVVSPVYLMASFFLVIITY